MMRAADLIQKKRDGGEHSPEEIREIVRAALSGEMRDYQVAAWLMAVYFRGMSSAETLALALAMRDSGNLIDLHDVPGIKLDKHSTGGVGDKTSLVVVPILAAAGVPILKMSGRGLGFSGGTIDKLESIRGFRAGLSIGEAVDQLKRVGAAMIGQTPGLVPADKMLYGLRDVTATVESIPLIAASIMSKKLAAGADAVLLDVKVGRGAFMKIVDDARTLAKTMVEIGRGAGVKTVAALTAMDEPLGTAVGNALEVREACETLTSPNQADRRFRELCVTLAARGLVMTGRAAEGESAKSVADGLLVAGKAAAKFEEIIAAQGGIPEVVRNPQALPAAPIRRSVVSDKSGYVTAIDAEDLGKLVMRLGAGREKKEDKVDPAVGLVLMKKTGDSVEAGQELAQLYLRKESQEEEAVKSILEAFALSERPATVGPVIYEFIE